MRFWASTPSSFRWDSFYRSLHCFQVKREAKKGGIPGVQVWPFSCCFLQLIVVCEIDGVLYKMGHPEWTFSESTILPEIAAKAAGEKSVQKREQLSAVAYRFAGIAIPINGMMARMSHISPPQKTRRVGHRPNKTINRESS